MNDCCVKNLEKMHDMTDKLWWLQRFILASPFILIIPDFDPTMASKEVIELGIEKSTEFTYDQATSQLNINKNKPDWADTVQRIGKGNYHLLRAAAQGHAGNHIVGMKDRKISAFWSNMAFAYDKAFYS